VREDAYLTYVAKTSGVDEDEYVAGDEDSDAAEAGDY